MSTSKRVAVVLSCSHSAKNDIFAVIWTKNIRIEEKYLEYCVQRLLEEDNKAILSILIFIYALMNTLYVYIR